MDVSVIIPVYNTEKYLSACIDSVLQQDNVSFEIILVDDGSTDSSANICDTYAKDYDNIKAIHIQNSGPATAKNIGLKHVQGNYIALTDSDDKMEPLMLFKMVSAGYKYDADISHLNSTNQQYILNHEEGLIHFFSKDKIYSQCWTKLYKRQMLVDNGIENDPGLRTDEDFIFNIRAFIKARTTVIVVTQDAVKNETEVVKEWSIVHIIMYYNELLGKVALFPELHSDKRIRNIINYIRNNKQILNRHYKQCGFSKKGVFLISFLPSSFYMQYRKTKN